MDKWIHILNGVEPNPGRVKVHLWEPGKVSDHLTDSAVVWSLTHNTQEVDVTSEDM